MAYGYPLPEEAPQQQGATKNYRNVPADNPYLSGGTLTFLSKVVSAIGPLQTFLWRNAQFGTLRHLKVLEAYPPRFNPTVIPTEEGHSGPLVTQGLFDKKLDTSFYTSADYVHAYKSQKTTPTAVAEYLLGTIQEPLHRLAFIQIREDLTLEAAKRSTERYSKGTPLGPLDGVPITVKDEVDVHGYEKTFGTAKKFDRGEGETTWCVKKLEEAGAIIIGKTNMHELGTDTTNNNPVHGTPRNPFNTLFYTGGSSGGSAYTVGAGLVPIAVGADGGGSIRVPSSYCGVYGIKPSHGRLSGRPSPSLTPSNGVLGPIAGSLQDLALAYRIMSAPDPRNPDTTLFPTPAPLLKPIHSTPKKVIGIYRPWFDDCDSVVGTLCNEAVDRLASQGGYEIIEIPFIPYLNETRLAHALSIVTDMTTALDGDFSQYNAANKILLSVASRTPAIDYAAASKVRTMMMSHFAYLFQKHPGMILVTPTTPLPGVKIDPRDISAGVSDTNTSLKSMRYVFLANFIGTPAINVGVGYVEDTRVPIGLMGMAEWGREEDLLGWGKDVVSELAEGKKRKRGEIWVDVLRGVGIGEYILDTQV